MAEGNVTNRLSGKDLDKTNSTTEKLVQNLSNRIENRCTRIENELNSYNESIDNLSMGINKIMSLFMGLR